MRDLTIANVEVQTDGRTVWINGSDGMNLGRFGRVGVDVHKDTAGQIAGGHCEDCFPRSEDAMADWARFVRSVERVHGVAVPAEFRPDQ